VISVIAAALSDADADSEAAIDSEAAAVAVGVSATLALWLAPDPLQAVMSRTGNAMAAAGRRQAARPRAVRSAGIGSSRRMLLWDRYGSRYAAIVS
jgi:hypothetical protein